VNLQKYVLDYQMAEAAQSLSCNSCKGDAKESGQNSYIPDDTGSCTPESPGFSSPLYFCQMGHQESKKWQLTCRQVVVNHLVGKGNRQGERSDHGRYSCDPLVMVFGYDLR
jgi:hypothetical protein